MATINYVIKNNFQPFSFQERLAPYLIYKEAYEKIEDKYYEMKDRANVFKYLSSTLPENSKARQIYEGFADDLEKQSSDFLQNGLTIPSKAAFTALRGRLKGEIGMLEQADAKYREEKKIRDALRASGKQVLYAKDNPTIDDFLPGEKFNDYSIGTDALYTAGFNAAKSASTRKFWAGDAGSVMGYYKDWVQRQGYTEEQISQWSDEMRERLKENFISDAVTSLPGLQKSLRSILESEGVIGNLKGNSFSRAFEATLRGMVDGAMLQEQHTPTRDLSTISAEAQAGIDMQKAQLQFQKNEARLNRLMHGFDENGEYLGFDQDPTYQREAALIEARAKAKTNNSSGGGSSASRGAKLQQSRRVTWVKDTDGKLKFKESENINTNPSSGVGEKYTKHVGEPVLYSDLSPEEQDYVDKLNIDPSLHTFTHIDDDNYLYHRLQIDPNDVSVTTGLENLIGALGGVGDGFDPNKIPQ